MNRDITSYRTFFGKAKQITWKDLSINKSIICKQALNEYGQQLCTEIIWVSMRIGAPLCK
jgi:hypothetical protein